MKFIPTFIAATVLAIACSDSVADTIFLLDGKTVSGTVTAFSAKGFDLTLADGTTRQIPTSIVYLIDFERAERKPSPTAPKTVKISLPTPDGLLTKAKSLGLHEEMSWRKSRISDEWIAQLRCFNGPAGVKLSSKQVLASSGLSTTNNELNVQLLGSSQQQLTSVKIEAEIYRSNYAADTFKLGTATIKALHPDCPADVITAFQDGRNLKSGQWEVARSSHNAGYDVKLVRRIGG